jgi:signal transduction histidine kinase/HD-like signal output (HDOD) protein/ActR/RegA family two-component response regulator
MSASHTILAKLEDCSDLPTIAPVAVEVLEAAMDQESSAGELAGIINRDPSLTANVLKVANSPYYRFASGITNVDRAIVAMGFGTVRNIVLATSAIGAFKDADGNPELDKSNFWRHSLACGIAAREILTAANVSRSADAYLVGMMHDAGKLVLDIGFSEEYREVLLEALAGDEPFEAIERRILGIDHAQVGHWLMNRWKFPEVLSSPVALHHRPESEFKGSEQVVQTASAVVLANNLAHQLGVSCISRPVKPALEMEAFNRFSLDRDQIKEIIRIVSEELEAVCSAMGVSRESAMDPKARKAFQAKSHEAGKQLQESSIQLDAQKRRLAEEVGELSYLNDLMMKLENCPTIPQALELIVAGAVEAAGGAEAVCWIEQAGVDDRIEASAVVNADGTPQTDLHRGNGKPTARTEDNGAARHKKDIVVRDRRIGEISVLSDSSEDRPKREAQQVLDLTARIAGLVIERINKMQEYRRHAEKLAQMHSMLSNAHNRLKTMHEELVLQAKFHALGRVASGVAHDFNNILAPILGQVQLAMGRTESEDLLRDLSIVEQAALNGAQVVKRVQDLAKVGGNATVKKPLLLSDAAQGAIELTRYKWAYEADKSEVRYDVVSRFAETPPCVGDPEELKQAFVNLILNALDAMPQGGTLEVATGPAGPKVWASVRDTGNGIPRRLRESIFDPFVSTKGERGCGLGLSIVGGIVSQHGGHIEAHSANDWGSLFYLELPSDPTAVLETQPSSEGEADAGTLPIMIVEDEDHIRGMMAEALSIEGHRVVSFSNGHDALEAFHESPCEVVVTDLAMPGMSGWELADAIRQSGRTAKTVLVTGWGQEISTEECQAHGVDMVLAKPFRLKELREAVATAPTDARSD